jgi:hypothetical protein
MDHSSDEEMSRHDIDVDIDRDIISNRSSEEVDDGMYPHFSELFPNFYTSMRNYLIDRPLNIPYIRKRFVIIHSYKYMVEEEPSNPYTKSDLVLRQVLYKNVLYSCHIPLDTEIEKVLKLTFENYETMRKRKEIIITIMGLFWKGLYTDLSAYIKLRRRLGTHIINYDR